MQGEGDDLASDDGDGRESFPEGHALAAVIAESGAGALDSVDEADQALQSRHGGIESNRSGSRSERSMKAMWI